MSGMPQVVAEALPKPDRRRPIRSAAAEPPGDAEPRAGMGQPADSGPQRLPRPLRGVRVLVVDDDEDAVDLFATVLGICGADVATATSATAAMRAFESQPPDVVVTDIAMPEADGYWLVDKIRQLPDARARVVPVVAVTAFSREHSRARALAAGFVEHLEKPVEPEALCLAVARAVGR